MNNNKQVVKHLEFIQGVVNRLGRNASLLKGWSMTVLVAGSLLMVRLRPDEPLLVLTLLLPAIGFWLLDAYFLWQERLFRKEYNRVRKQDETDFTMDQMQHKHKPGSSRCSVFFSETLRIFYGMEIAFILVLFGFFYFADIPACCQ